VLCVRGAWKGMEDGGDMRREEGGGRGGFWSGVKGGYNHHTKHTTHSDATLFYPLSTPLTPHPPLTHFPRHFRASHVTQPFVCLPLHRSRHL
jgi:hypothetical protein